MVKALYTAWISLIVMFIASMLWVWMVEHDRHQCVKFGGYPVMVYGKIECVEINKVPK